MLSQDAVKTIKTIALACDPNLPQTVLKKVEKLLTEAEQKKQRTLVTPKKAAEILECSKATIGRLAARGHLNKVRYSKSKVRYDLDEVMAFAENGMPTDS